MSSQGEHPGSEQGVGPNGGASAVDMDDAIAERPREISRYPLLEAVYDRHDRLISEWCHGDTLEVAHGQYAHPEADTAIDIFPANVQSTHRPAVVGDVRQLPFADDTFDTVIGRRFLHHVPRDDRSRLITECQRVLRPGGHLVILEGTPGIYRRVVKGLGFALGVLGEDTDDYGHLSPDEVRQVVESQMEVVHEQPLGSPIMPLAIGTHSSLSSLVRVVERTQTVRWWTLLVGETPASE